jgi:cbb3-type cytochrome oxidase maturation protein
MESLYLLIPIALVFCVIAIKLLLWAIDSGQYDDLDKEAWRILADDDDAAPNRDTSGHDNTKADDQT